MMRLILALTLLLAGPVLAAGPSPVGIWRTIDDKTGRERSLVQIEETDGVLHGRVLSTVDPADAAHVCEKCDDDRKGQPVIGLEIIRGMRPDGDSWGEGRVLDPETGHIYHGTMRLEDGGRKLVLRGYIGISLFGRSQTWLRAAP